VPPVRRIATGRVGGQRYVPTAAKRAGSASNAARHLAEQK
jgi:hypothetical protein